MDGLRYLVLVLVVLHSSAAISARGCGSGLQVRSTADPRQQIDLSRLSPKQLQVLVQQLAAWQDEGKQDEEGNRDEEEEQDELMEEYEEDHRGSSRPWSKVQRIIRRQLVKVPRRYLKKILRQFGLARSVAGVRSASVRSTIPRQEEYYLIPLN